MVRSGRVGRVDWEECKYCEHFTEDTKGTHCAKKVWTETDPNVKVTAFVHKWDELNCMYYHERKHGKDFYEETGWDWRTAKP